MGNILCVLLGHSWIVVSWVRGYNDPAYNADAFMCSRCKRYKKLEDEE